jgi:tetratricopeptide (TPR) repeat protein
VTRKTIHRTALFFALFSVILAACTQYKNKPINRGYHNMTSRFNVYFYAKESLKEGVTKLEENHKDDYSKLLPVFIYGDKETSKEIFPEMDRVIKKSSLCITRHAIKDKKTKQEIFGAVKWIDNAWMALGKAQFYKREFFSASETFDFVATTYKSKEKFEAWMWLVKTYNEMGLLSQSEPYINLIRNDPKFPKEFKGDFDALYAEFYIKQGLYDEAIKQLNEAISHTKNKKVKARYLFILGQLYEERADRNENEADTKKAVAQYKKVLAKKPAYEMEFNTRIKLALLADYTPETSRKLKTNLIKMLKDVKNDEYHDVIYYTLGQLEERDKNYEVAFGYYKKSAAESKTNNVQKAKSYLRIAEMSFDQEDYTASKTYYDSTITFMKEDYPGYKNIVNKQKSLDVLVGHINTIKEQDSLLALANMDTTARNERIRKMIAKMEEDEQKAKELKEQQLQDNDNPQNPGNTPFQPIATTGAWYFYNPQTKLFGINDFIKKWGNQRKNEDNWRRASKQVTIDPWQNDTSSAGPDSSAVKKDSVPANTKTVAYYLKDLPLTKDLQDSAHSRILESYYALGTIYREQLNNTKRAAATFDKMNDRYPGNKYEASSYYQMYRIYLQEKNQPKAEEYKNLILTRYPNSDYALIIKDPNFASDLNAKKSVVEAFYTKTYELYTQGNFGQALGSCNEALRKYGKNEFTPKFAFLRALCVGRTQPIDSAEAALKMVVVKYPDDPVFAPAKAMLDAIQKAKNPQAAVDTVKKEPVKIDPDAYRTKDSTEHYWVICIPQNRGDVMKFKNKLSNFNNQYFSTEKYSAQTLVLGTETVVFLKSFKNKDDAMSYQNFIMKKPDVFSDLQKEVMSTFVITVDNMVKLIKKKDINEYKAFYNASYVNKKNP